MRNRKIKFPLIMKDDIKVRTLEDLQTYFDLERTIAYYANGKLVKWLQDHYEDEIAEQIMLLDQNSDTLIEQICDLLGVKPDNASTVSLEYIRARNEKQERVKQITDDKEIISNFDKVMFSQDELNTALSSGAEKLYLYGTNFCILPEYHNVTIIGLNNPSVDFEGHRKLEYTRNKIFFQNVNLLDRNDFDDMSVGDIIEIGEFNGETLKWKMIKKEDDKALMLCTACVAKISVSAYSQEKICQWMNDEFYNTVFDEEIKKLILIVRDEYRIILLGKYIASTCFNANIERQASYIANPYRIKKDETNNLTNNITSGLLGIKRRDLNTSSSPNIGGTITSWDLRDNYRVNEGGAIELGNASGIRPAFWVSIKQ